MNDSQILYNIKQYAKERQNQLQDRYECTSTDYSLGKLDLIDGLVNFIEVEEMMTRGCHHDFNYDIYEI